MSSAEPGSAQPASSLFASKSEKTVAGVTEPESPKEPHTEDNKKERIKRVSITDVNEQTLGENPMNSIDARRSLVKGASTVSLAASDADDEEKDELVDLDHLSSKLDDRARVLTKTYAYVTRQANQVSRACLKLWGS
jgi:hypothetical protein